MVSMQRTCQIWFVQMQDLFRDYIIIIHTQTEYLNFK